MDADCNANADAHINIYSNTYADKYSFPDADLNAYADAAAHTDNFLYRRHKYSADASPDRPTAAADCAAAAFTANISISSRASGGNRAKLRDVVHFGNRVQ